MSSRRMTSVLLLLLPIALAYLTPSHAGFFESENARATFYGGSDAGGTMGGACGYGNLYETGYGTDTAAASHSLFQDGLMCGACYRVTCLNSPACTGSTTVTVTNRCPPGSEGGWCNPPKHHLDMAMPAWLKMANNPKVGVVQTKMTRVPCLRKGGVTFQFGGNPWFFQVTVSNVGGPGAIKKLEVDGGSGFQEVQRNWGSVFSTHGQFMGKSLTFRLTSQLDGSQLLLRNAVPSSWGFSQRYSAAGNWNAVSGGGGSSSKKPKGGGGGKRKKGGRPYRPHHRYRKRGRKYRNKRRQLEEEVEDEEVLFGGGYGQVFYLNATFGLVSTD